MPFSDRQTTSVALKRAGDPEEKDRVAGLVLGARAPSGSWPTFTIQGGLINKGEPYVAYLGRLDLDAPGGAGDFGNSFRTLPYLPLGQIAIPGDTPGTPTETSDWSSIKLSYSGDFDLTLSRATPAALIETSVTSLRLLSGTANKRHWDTPWVYTTTDAPILPKYVAWHAADGYHVQQITTSSINLTGMDQPWLLVWYGDQHHWIDTLLPTSYAYAGSLPGGLTTSYIHNADCPLLLTFSSNPTSIVRDPTAASGFDLAFAGGAKKISVLPLYGRLRLRATAASITYATENALTSGLSATESWGAGLPAAVQTRIQAWYPRLGWFPRSMFETYAYNAGTDTATITETVTWTQVLSSGGVKLAPLPPVVGVARATDLDISVSTTVTDTDLPTEFGPHQGVTGANSYSWSVTGLATYAEPRIAAGSGTIPSDVQTEINDQVDALVAAMRGWQPWYFADHVPDITVAGDVYFNNPADTLAIVAEVLPFVSGSRRTSLLAWIDDQLALHDPLTEYDLTPPNGTPDGTARGAFGTPGSQSYQWKHLFSWRFDQRQTAYAAWAFARYYQESGLAVPDGLVSDLVALVDADLAERDWATGCHLTTDRLQAPDTNDYPAGPPRQLSTENTSRDWAGLAGLAWLAAQESHADEADIRVAFARATVTRVAQAYLPRYYASSGIQVAPTGNPSWNSQLATTWIGWLFQQGATDGWNDETDDPRRVVKMDQFHVWLAESTMWFGYAQGGYPSKSALYKGFTRPLASLLDDTVPGVEDVGLEKHRILQPNWYVPFATAVHGMEHNTSHPGDAHALFLARAWLDQASAATLEREAAYPWLSDGGDLFYLQKLTETARAYAGEGATGTPVISDINDNRADYTGSLVPRFSPLLVTCQVATEEERNPYLMHDPTAPHAEDQTGGISVDLEISASPVFGTYETIPCAWIEEYDRETHAYLTVDSDWIYPNGESYWRAGYMPEATGTYYYRIRAVDVAGESVSGTSSFTVTAALAGRHGPLRVSPNDPRYFEYADGTYWSGAGLGYQTASGSEYDDPVNESTPHLEDFGDNKLRLTRYQVRHAGVFGDYQPEFSSPISVEDLPFHSRENSPVDYPFADGGPEYSTYCSDYAWPCWGIQRRGWGLKPSTTYRVRAKYSITAALNGPLVGGDAWGFGFKVTDTYPAQYVSYGGQTVWWPVVPGNGTLIGGTLIHGPTDGWVTTTFGTFTTGASQHFLEYFFQPCVQSVGSPTQPVHIAEVYVEEDLGGGAWGPNIVGVHPSDLHKRINQRYASNFDVFMGLAEDNEIVVKAVMLDTGHYWAGVMDAAGDMSLTWNNGRFYGENGSRNRWIQRNAARYFVARWGWRPNLIWEFLNEGDPGEQDHFSASEDWASEIVSYGNRRLTSNSVYQSVGASLRTDMYNYAPTLDLGDFHAYPWPDASYPLATVGSPGGDFITMCQWPTDYYDVAGLVIRTSNAVGALRPNGIGRPVIIGELGLNDDDGPLHYPAMSDAAKAVKLHKITWAQSHHGGVIPHWWHALDVYDPSVGTPNDLSMFLHYGTFIEQFTLSNGLFADAAAVCDNVNLRVIGQKDTTNGRAYLWVDNAGANGDSDNTAHNWRTVNAGLTPTAKAGTVTLALPAGDYDVTPFDPYAGTYGSTAVITSNGTLSVPIASLSTDRAYLIETQEVVVPTVGSLVVNQGLNSVHLVAQGYGVTDLVGNVISQGMGTDRVVAQGYTGSVVILGNAITQGVGTDRLVTQGYSAGEPAAPGIYTGTGTGTATASADATGFKQTFGSALAVATAEAVATGLVQVFGTGAGAAQALAYATGPGGTVPSASRSGGRLGFALFRRLRF